jgi:hypothetical protein
VTGMGGDLSDDRRRLQGPAWLLDLGLHGIAVLLVVAAIDADWGREAAIVAALLFPVTYLVGPLTLGIVAGQWFAFSVQLVAILGSVTLLGIPRLDREQETARGCLQLLASTVLVVIVDLALHVAALALTIDRINQGWGSEAAVSAAILFPVTYLIGPLGLLILTGDWLPLLVQLAALGIIGLLLILSDSS